RPRTWTRRSIRPFLIRAVRTRRCPTTTRGCSMSSSSTSLGPVLQARGISKRFGGLQAVSEVDLTVGQGEHVALVGDNGAGKSTLVKMLTGAESPDSGEVWFDGSIVHFHSPL